MFVIGPFNLMDGFNNNNEMLLCLHLKDPVAFRSFKYLKSIQIPVKEYLNMYLLVYNKR